MVLGKLVPGLAQIGRIDRLAAGIPVVLEGGVVGRKGQEALGGVCWPEGKCVRGWPFWTSGSGVNGDQDVMKFVAVVFGVIAIGVVAVVIYALQVDAPEVEIEVVIPDDKLPN
jgi:hypothetical protein